MMDAKARQDCIKEIELLKVLTKSVKLIIHSLVCASIVPNTSFTLIF